MSQTTPWGIDMVRAPLAWQDATGNGAKVLLIDSGIDGHRDLPSIPSPNCDGILGSGNCATSTSHGTMVAGVIMALDNNQDIVGVAPGISGSDVYSYNACTSTCPITEIMSGLQFGITNNVDVINISLSGPTHNTGYSNMITSAWNAGIVIVASAGNIPSTNYSPGDIVYPAGYTEVIGVSGVGDNGIFASSPTAVCSNYSNHGSHVSIAAPFSGDLTGYNDSIVFDCGTSGSAPYISGAAALLFEQNPTWTNVQVRNRLLNTANHPFGSMTPDQEYGYGVLDAAAALGQTLPIYPSIDGPNQIQLNQYVEFDASAEGGLKPYSFEWQIDYTMTGNSWQTVGSSASFYGHQSYTLDDFMLRVIVTDANNDTGTSTFHQVTVTY